jgi:hypothetical protein
MWRGVCYMQDVLFKTIITFFVFYALIDIVSKLLSMIFVKKPYCNEDVFVILKVKNQETNLEYLIRTLIWKNLSISRGGYIPNVIIVDMGSDDNTKLIGEKLACDYSFIHYMTNDDYLKLKDTFTF